MWFFFYEVLPSFIFGDFAATARAERSTAEDNGLYLVYCAKQRVGGHRVPHHLHNSNENCAFVSALCTPEFAPLHDRLELSEAELKKIVFIMPSQIVGYSQSPSKREGWRRRCRTKKAMCSTTPDMCVTSQTAKKWSL